MALRTKLTERLGIRHPVLLAPISTADHSPLVPLKAPMPPVTADRFAPEGLYQPSLTSPRPRGQPSSATS